MNKIFMILTFLVFSFFSGTAAAQVSFNMSVNDGGSSFFMSIGDYFHVPHSEVVFVRDRHIPEDEIPVVFFLAKRARVAPSAIIDMRLRGIPWMDISLHYGLGPDIFYFPVRKNVVLGPPYGKAYGHFKEKPKYQWKKIRLADDDIVNLVNLRFISEHHHYAPEKVIVMRGEGRNFVYIDDDIRKGKKQHVKEREERQYRKKEKKEEQAANHREKTEKHKDKGKGKGKREE